MYILVTGGAGYIGSHTVVELINNGFKVVIVDNLTNSSYDAVSRIEYLVHQTVPFFNVDIRDEKALSKIFDQYDISGVIHFAALKAVGESTKIPLEYYENNVGGTVSLLKVMSSHNVKTIVFSSSATVYGDATRFENMIPIPEHCPNDPTNPYGKTKYVIENIIHDVFNSDKSWQAAILRYFNPIGAHPSGLLGEDPLGIPNNLLPYLAQVAIGRREKLSIFGNDYDSHDGTPIRDYIHVVDLARGHISALKYLHGLNSKGLFREWNLGTGRGSTVFEVYNAFCKAVGRELPYEVVGRRAGDVLNLTANPERAHSELNWKAEFNIDDACNDLWKWTTENPFGFNIKGYTWEKLDGFTNRLHTIKVGDFSFSCMNLGSAIQKVKLGDHIVSVALDTDAEYKSQTCYLGATIGRYANRISSGKYKNVSLDQNDNGNTLHGGSVGFDKQIFFGPVVKSSAKGYTMEFSHKDKDGNNGFPGDLITNVKYTISGSTNSGLIDIEYQAKLESGEETPINLTNHSYWNISSDKIIDGTKIDLKAKQVLEVDENLLPTGSFETLDIDKLGSLDNCFVVSKSSKLDTRGDSMIQVLKASHESSPVTLTVSTTEPSFQVYTGDYIDIPGKFGPRSGFAVEPGRFIDAINNEKYAPSVLLPKGQVYGSKIQYAFEK